MVGQTISHYKVLRKLGGGGMGVVYAAEDVRLHRQVALKFLSPALAHAPLAMARFEREALAASAFNHPHICTIHDIGRHVDAPFIVMELMDGMSLRECLAKGPMPLPALIRLAIQVADALETAHAAGIVHRDLTPSNIFVTRRGDAKVLDFGIVKLLSEQASEREAEALTAPADTPITGKGHVVGTPGYASPEQTLGLEVDARTDIFSLGVILYQMATGCRPFDAQTPGLVNDAVVHAQPVPAVQFNPQLPADLGAIIEKALEKDRGLRYQSAADLKADLRRLKRNLEAAGGLSASSSWPGTPPGPGWPITPTPFTPPPPAPPPATTQTGAARAGDWISRHPRLAGLAATFIVGAAIVLGVREWQRADPRPESVSRTVTSGTGSDLEPSVSPDGTRIVYVMEEGAERSLWMVDTNGVSGVPWKRGPARLAHPTWSPDGHRVLFQVDSGGRSSIHQAESINGEASTELLTDAAEPAVSPDGTQLAFVRLDRRSNITRIAVAPLSDTRAARFLTGEHDGLWSHSGPAWSPDGRHICYWAWDGLWVTPVQGGKARRLTRSDATDTDPVWSSSGYIYFSSKREGLWQLWRVPAGGGRPARVTVGLGVERAPSLSEDGALLAYSTFASGYGIAIQDLANGNMTRLSGGETDSGWPQLADGGRTLYFAMSAGGRQSIWRQALAEGKVTGPARPLLPAPAPRIPFSRALQPTCSPDGKWVAFMRLQAPALEDEEDWPSRFRRWSGLHRSQRPRPAPVRSIWIVSSAGGTPVRVTTSEAEEYLPRWSPDGAHIAFLRREPDRKTYLWLQPMAGGEPSGSPKRLLSDPVADTAVAWSPDGRQVALATQDEDVALAWRDGERTPRVIAKGARAKGFRWVAAQRLLVAGRSEAESIVVRAIDPASGGQASGFAPIDLGSDLVSSAFDISPDGRHLASTRSLSKSGRIGVLALTEGRF